VGKARPVENRFLPEGIIVGDRLYLIAAAVHGLEDKEISGDVLVDQIEREQRVAEVIEHAHKEHEIKLLTEHRNAAQRELQ
jgi:hypothetical protein